MTTPSSSSPFQERVVELQHSLPLQAIIVLYSSGYHHCQSLNLESNTLNFAGFVALEHIISRNGDERRQGGDPPCLLHQQRMQDSSPLKTTQDAPDEQQR